MPVPLYEIPELVDILTNNGVLRKNAIDVLEEPLLEAGKVWVLEWSHTNLHLEGDLGRRGRATPEQIKDVLRGLVSGFPKNCYLHLWRA